MWLKKGDKNTKYFHHKATQRRRKNKINKLQNRNGVWVGGSQLEDHILAYFQEIFSTSNPQGSKNFRDALEGRVTQSLNEELIWDFTREEVIATLQQMHPTKA